MSLLKNSNSWDTEHSLGFFVTLFFSDKKGEKTIRHKETVIGQFRCKMEIILPKEMPPRLRNGAIFQIIRKQQGNWPFRFDFENITTVNMTEKDLAAISNSLGGQPVYLYHAPTVKTSAFSDDQIRRWRNAALKEKADQRRKAYVSSRSTREVEGQMAFTI